MKSSVMENMKEMNLKELDKVNGGVIAKINGKYYASGEENDPCYYKKPFDTAEEAAVICRKYGWNTVVMNEKEFIEKYGRLF